MDGIVSELCQLWVRGVCYTAPCGFDAGVFGHVRQRYEYEMVGAWMDEGQRHGRGRDSLPQIWILAERETAEVKRRLDTRDETIHAGYYDREEIKSHQRVDVSKMLCVFAVDWHRHTDLLLHTTTSCAASQKLCSYAKRRTQNEKRKVASRFRSGLAWSFYKETFATVFKGSQDRLGKVTSSGCHEAKALATP